MLAILLARILIARNRKNDFNEESLVSAERFAVMVYGFSEEDIVTEDALKKCFSCFGAVYEVRLIYDIGEGNDIVGNLSDLQASIAEESFAVKELSRKAGKL